MQDQVVQNTHILEPVEPRPLSTESMDHEADPAHQSAEQARALNLQKDLAHKADEVILIKDAPPISSTSLTEGTTERQKVNATIEVKETPKEAADCAST